MATVPCQIRAQHGHKVTSWVPNNGITEDGERGGIVLLQAPGGRPSRRDIALLRQGNIGELWRQQGRSGKARPCRPTRHTDAHSTCPHRIRINCDAIYVEMETNERENENQWRRCDEFECFLGLDGSVRVRLRMCAHAQVLRYNTALRTTMDIALRIIIFELTR